MLGFFSNKMKNGVAYKKKNLCHTNYHVNFPSNRIAYSGFQQCSLKNSRHTLLKVLKIFCLWNSDVCTCLDRHSMTNSMFFTKRIRYFTPFLIDVMELNLKKWLCLTQFGTMLITLIFLDLFLHFHLYRRIIKRQDMHNPITSEHTVSNFRKYIDAVFNLRIEKEEVRKDKCKKCLNAAVTAVSISYMR